MFAEEVLFHDRHISYDQVGGIYQDFKYPFFQALISNDFGISYQIPIVIVPGNLHDQVFLFVLEGMSTIHTIFFVKTVCLENDKVCLENARINLQISFHIINYLRK